VAQPVALLRATVGDETRAGLAPGTTRPMSRMPRVARFGVSRSACARSRAPLSVTVREPTAARRADSFSAFLAIRDDASDCAMLALGSEPLPLLDTSPWPTAWSAATSSTAVAVHFDFRRVPKSPTSFKGVLEQLGMGVLIGIPGGGRPWDSLADGGSPYEDSSGYTEGAGEGYDVLAAPMTGDARDRAIIRALGAAYGAVVTAETRRPSFEAGAPSRRPPLSNEEILEIANQEYTKSPWEEGPPPPGASPEGCQPDSGWNPSFRRRKGCYFGASDLSPGDFPVLAPPHPPPPVVERVVPNGPVQTPGHIGYNIDIDPGMNGSHGPI